MKKALVLGAGGFIGNHMVSRLKKEGYWVRGVDVKNPEFSDSEADEFIIADLRDPKMANRVVAYMGELGNFYQNIAESLWQPFDEIYQFAADMGGAGYILTGDNDADVMHNSTLINLNVLHAVKMLNEKTKQNKTKIFYSSSACVYPEFNQVDPNNPNCEESSAYPAEPDSEYGWEKLFSERTYFAYNRNYGIPVRIARFHNIFGPQGTWRGGKEKSPAAICRKVAEVQTGGEIEIWGDGEQTRSFLFIDECIEAIRRLMESDFQGPVNIGSEEMLTINELARIVASVSNKNISIKHVNGPQGVRGRNSDNRLIKEKLGWDYEQPLAVGIKITYDWINSQI